MHGDIKKYKEEPKEIVKHNGIISFWKFAFCIMIIFLHVGLAVASKAKFMCAAGSIGVEFFFLISGYLMGKKALNYKEVSNKELGDETFKYIWKKIKNLFPWLLIAYIISVQVIYLINNLQKYQLINSIWDILFLKQSGIKYYSFLDVSWYISVMLIAMTILYPMILKYRKNFVYIIAPLIVTFVGGYLAHKYGNIASPDVWDGLVYKGFLRGFFEISLGVILYSITEKIKDINFNKLSKIILTFVEIAGFISIFIVVNVKNAHVKYDFVMILILSICISIAFSEKTLFFNIANNKFCYFLEKLSLPLYLNQMWVITLVNYIFEKYNFNYYQYTFLVIIIDILVSIIIIKIINILQNNIHKLKKIFIK